MPNSKSIVLYLVGTRQAIGGIMTNRNFAKFNYCNDCNLPYPKSENRCDCGQKLRSKPRNAQSRRNMIKVRI